MRLKNQLFLQIGPLKTVTPDYRLVTGPKTLSPGGNQTVKVTHCPIGLNM